MKLLTISVFIIVMRIGIVLSQNVFNCGIVQIKNINNLIMGGFKTTAGQWPWHVAIHHEIHGEKNYACGGTLVTNMHVITAAHCVKDGYFKQMPVNAIELRFGVHELSSTRTEIQLRKISKIHEIKNFSMRDLHNDIAILVLTTSVEFNTFVQLACVSVTEDLTGKTGTVIGWGSNEAEHVSNELKSAQLPVVDFYTCLKSDRHTFGEMLDEGIFCAGYTNGTSVCNGDSGGGLFFQENGAWHLGGIVAFSKKNETSNQCYTHGFGAFTKIHTYLSWIKTTTMLNLPEENTKTCREAVKSDVKKSFYVEAHLPYSIQRGETIPIQVTVFNFLDDTTTANVTLFNKDGEFDFVEHNSIDTDRSTNVVEIPASSGKTIFFMIKARKLGAIAITIEAVNQLQRDATEQILRVTPESKLYESYDARFIDLDSYGTKEHMFHLSIPRKADVGSIQIKFTVHPNLLGQPIKNLEHFIRDSTDNGEQNLVNFVQNIAILNYLTETGGVTQEVKTKAINYIKSCYQYQLNFKRPNGSFGIERSRNGSTFLTAFVATLLNMAIKFINVDHQVLNGAYQWLASIQQPDGQFREEQSNFNSDMQGGLLSTDFSLTAYILIAFNENEDIARQYGYVVSKMMSFLARNFLSISDPYDLALVSYGMALGKHGKQKEYFNKLLEVSQFDFDSGIRYWSISPFSVEVAGYALLTHLTEEDYISGIPVMRWLNQQHYDFRNNERIQDTFVALKALAAMAAKISVRRNDYEITIKDRLNLLYVVNVDDTKSAVIEQKLPDDVKSMHVQITGIGHGLFNVTYSYKQNIEIAKHRYILNVEVLKTSFDVIPLLKVCVTFVAWEKNQRSNNTFIEIFFARGTVVVPNAVKNLSPMHEIRFEPRFGATSVVVYYASLGEETACFEVSAFRNHEDALQLPSYVVAYDDHNRDWFAIKKFNLFHKP